MTLHRALGSIVVCSATLFLCVSAAMAAESPTASDPPKNNLADETSPYLLMHVHDPVNWHPWGNEALEKARRQDKLIFLSVGYSSCYWCHVMQRESFLDKEVADYLNEHFVCIKVDREERPDIDEIYMTALQVYYRLIGSPQGGGWPLSMFLTPEGDPIFGGTYFPPRGKVGRRGFVDVLRFIQNAWQEQPAKIRQDSQTLVEAVRQSLDGSPATADAELDHESVRATLAAIGRQFDPEYGGFGFSEDNPQQPKFPEPSNLLFLVGIAARSNDQAEEAEAMLMATLEHMARGGIRDHLGGGFHRYSTDRFWGVPHFEKMLYDNAQLATVYAEAYDLTRRSEFAAVTRSILDFVQAEMTSPEGGFYAAIDAETDATEGKFYLWTSEELDATLSSSERAVLDEVYGTGGEPAIDEHHVLLLPAPVDAVAGRRGQSPAELRRTLASIRTKLLQRRNQRQRPLTDTKILTAWNGLMIRGFADAGRILEEPRYVDAARSAVQFVLDELQTDDGRLLRSYAGGQAQLNAYLDDYAFLVDGLLALHAATDNPQWLRVADRLTQRQLDLFWDSEQGGFYYTSHDHEQLFARSRKSIDGALPSGGSVTADNLLTLVAELGKPRYRELAGETITAALPLMDRAPAAAPRMSLAVGKLLAAEPIPSD